MKVLFVAFAVTIATAPLGLSPASAAQETLCGSSYMADRVAVKAFTDKGDHVTGGETQGIDVNNVTCETRNKWSADHWIDIYRNGTVYKRVGTEWRLCAVYVGGWRGTFTDWVYTWRIDMDDVSGKCGWGSGPIKVRHIGKGEWSDGTIKTKTVYVNDSKL